MAVGHIDDGEPGVPQDHIAFDMNASVVRAPVNERVQHALDGLLVTAAETAGNATHR